MLRRLRFGTLSLFAAMLLVVSGAGWWKFHRDLYVEEIEVLAALKKEAKGVGFTRPAPGEVTVGLSSTIDDEIPWNAPWLDPVSTIWVFGDASEPTRARALALPRLLRYSEEPVVERKPGRVGVFRMEWIPRSVAPDDLLGRPLPALPEPTLDPESLQRPLPNGEELDRSHAAEIAETIRLAWQRSRPAYPRRLVVEKTAAFFAGTTKVLNVEILEEDRTLTFVSEENRPEVLSLSDDIKRDGYSFDGAWRRTVRSNRTVQIEAGEARRGYPTEDYPYLGIDLNAFGTSSGAVLERRRLEADRVARIDDVHYRVDFKSFNLPEKPRPRSQSSNTTVISWSCVLRSDLDWAPEDVRLTKDILSPIASGSAAPISPPQRSERRLAQRFERRGEYVLLVERLSEEVHSNMPSKVQRERMLAATEFDPEYDEAVFDSQALDPAVWPDRQPLPFWRWYRVTFAISVAIFVYLIGRSARGFARRGKPASQEAAESTDSEEPSEAASPIDA